MLSFDPAEAAVSLAQWFTSLRETLDKTVFSVGDSEPHQRAAARNVITRHVAELDDAVEAGQQAVEVREIAWILAGATRALGVQLRPNQWLSATQNVARLDVQVDGLGTPWVGDIVSIFRDHFFEALRQAGVTRTPTILSAANRQTALGLSVNWGLRYLVAAAAGLGDEVTDPAVGEIVAAVSGGAGGP